MEHFIKKKKIKSSVCSTPEQPEQSGTFINIKSSTFKGLLISFLSLKKGGGTNGTQNFKLTQILNSNIMKKTFYVPRPKFDEISKVISCATILEKGCSVGSVRFENKEYVITGGIGTGTGVGYSACWGKEIVPLLQYKGELKPVEYLEHNLEVTRGKRERGYNSMIIKNNGIKVVMTGSEITFMPRETEIQKTLF